MWVISRRPLRDFWTIHPDARGPLKRWIRLAEKASWASFAEVRADFPGADQVGRLTVFDIGGNKYRLIVNVRFDQFRVYVHDILTHRDYDKGG